MAPQRIVLIFALLLASGAASSWETLTGNLDLDCTQNRELSIDCSYRLLIPEPPLSISAGYNGKSLSISNKESYPSKGGITAAVLLVDTSDPARQAVIEQNKRQIRRILTRTDSHHRIGLASFDKALQVEAPIGSDNEHIIKASDRLKATGLTTELYRNTIKAIDLLAGVDAERKVIFLFSDGQAEDKAYFHQDVIRAARRNNVIINSLGFQRSLPLSVALQTLRRLSEETGGVYIEADKNHVLPDPFLERPFDNIDRGGRFMVNLESLSSLPADQTDITLTFATDLGDISIEVPVSLPVKPAPASAGRPQPVTPRSAQPVQIVTAPASEEIGSLDQWLWYGVPAALLILVLLTVFTLFVLLRKTVPKKAVHQTRQEQFKPYAYLIAQDEKATRYPITRTTWRIGRSRDNEMTLDDNSVSRRHAEIQRLASGKFMIYDHDSLNGIFVNEEKVSKQKLEEGDIIEIGDFFLRFTEHPYDYQLGEDTVMQKTRAPSF